MALEQCFSTVDVCFTRVAKLLPSGAPEPGPNNGYVSDAQISVGISPQIEEGADRTKKNGCGAICATKKDDDRYKNIALSLVLCQLDYELIELLAGTDTFTLGPDTVGWQYPSVNSTATRYVSVEFWSRAWDGDAQAVPTVTAPNPAWHHWVFPKVRWTLGDWDLSEEIADIPLSGTSDENSQITPDGPFNDWPAYITAQGGITNIGGSFFDAVVPTAQCGYIPVP